MPRSLFKFKISQKHFLLGLVIGVGLLWGMIRSWPDGKLHIIFCDIGQGDSIYIKTPDRRDILIDGGPNNRVLNCLGKHMSLFDRTIDLVIVTHPEKDHIGGIPEVLKRFQVKHYLTTPVLNILSEFDQTAKEIEDGVPKVSYIHAGDVIRLGEIQIDFLWPDMNWFVGQTGTNNNFDEQALKSLPAVDQLNTYSLISLLRYEEFEVLFTGDADREPQRLIMSLGLNQKIPHNIDVLKVPHHGSKTGIDQEFLDWISPDTAVIQVGKNSYGHPHPDLLKQLSGVDRVFRNDTQGDIEIISDGKLYVIKTEK